jgi:hypothetical protein
MSPTSKHQQERKVMLSKSIYINHLLTIKPNNPKYIKRYVNYLELCEIANIDTSVYMERHHILPKASDMFPQYRNLLDNPWNGIELTAKQHIVAHIILKKAYPKSRSAIASVHYYLNVQNSSTIDFNRRDIPDVIKALYAAKAKEDYYESRKGYGCWVNIQTGEREFLHRDDPKLKSNEYVWIKYRKKHTEQTKNILSKRKDYMKKIKLYFLDNIIKVLESEYEEYIAQGWLPYLTPDDKEFAYSIKYSKSSNSLKGRSDYMLPDGTYYGKLYKDDPIIAELGLVFHQTENRISSAIKNAKFATEANTGSTWYNNGEINKKFKTDPGYPWVIGQINISDEAKKARADGVRKARANKKCYHDGKNNYYFSENEVVPEGLIPGMAPQKKRAVTNKNSGYSVYNDGVKAFKVFSGDYIDPTWKKGMLPRKNKP